MTDVPYTPTLTINLDDNPLIFTLERNPRGNPEWRIRWDPAFLADPATVRTAILQLSLTSATWFYQQYGVPTPDPIDAATEGGQQLLTALTDAHNHTQAALTHYQQLLDAQEGHPE